MKAWVVGTIQGLPLNLGAKWFLPAIPPCFTGGETEAQQLNPFSKDLVLAAAALSLAGFIHVLFCFLYGR